MKIPSLKEVFVIREVNVTTLAQMNKIPIELAGKINDFDRKNADILTMLFVCNYTALGNRFAYPSEK